MFDKILGTQHGLIMEASENVTNYDVACARLLTENTLNSTKNLIPVIDNSSDKYIKKIDDSFEVLSAIAVDTDEVTAFFTDIQNTSELDEIPLSTPLKNINDIGRIKPEYLVQVAKDAASTINEIVNGRVSLQDLMNYFSNGFMIKVKKQVVISSKGISDVRSYLKSQENPNIVPMDSQAIRTLCIPFLRSFTVKKRELQEEINSVKNAINTTSTLMRSYTDTANGLKSKGQLSEQVIDVLNYYLYNLNRAIDECCTFMTFCLLTKIESYTFNINSYLELYRKVTAYNPEGKSVYHESVYENSLAGHDIDTAVNMAVYGNLSPLKDYAMRTFDKAKSTYVNAANNKVENIDFLLNYEDEDYPYGSIIDSMFNITRGLDTITASMRDALVSPEVVIKRAGFENTLTGRFGIIVSEITSISKYTDQLNNGKAKSAVLFQILSEMKKSDKDIDDLGNVIKEVFDKIKEVLQYLEINEDNAIPNELARREMINLVTNIERDFRNFLGILFENMIQRYKRLEDEAISLVDGMETKYDVEPEESENLNFNALAVEACMDIDDIFSRYMIECEMDKFKQAKIYKEYGVMMEWSPGTATGSYTTTKAPEQTTAATEPQATKTEVKPAVKPQKTKPTNKKEQKVEVIDNSNENPEAAKQNEAAKAKEEVTPEQKTKKRRAFKELQMKIQNFVNDVTLNFNKSMGGKNAEKGKAIVEQYKDVLLSRSYTNVELRIYNYFNIKSQQMITDVKSLSNNVSGLTKENLGTTNLFDFIRFPDGQYSEDYVRLYYKVGAGQQKVEKVSIKNSALKTKTAEMIAFCEDFYVNNGYQTLFNEIENLKKVIVNKINSLNSEGLTDEEFNNLRNRFKEILIFIGAVLTGFRNRCQHYLYALKKLVPESASTKAENEEKTNEAEPQLEGETAQQPKE